MVLKKSVRFKNLITRTKQISVKIPKGYVLERPSKDIIGVLNKKKNRVKVGIILYKKLKPKARKKRR